MLDLIVIGGGFWGAATAALAAEDGRDVVLLDDAQPRGASRNAACLVRWGAYAGDTVKRLLPADWRAEELSAGAAWLQARCGLTRTGEDFSSYRAPGSWKERADCWTLEHPERLLGLHPAVGERAVRCARVGKHWRVDTDLAPWEARHVVVAAGVWTDALLTASGLAPVGVTRLRGRAVLFGAELALGRPRTYQARPYVDYVLRPWTGGRWRWGDTVERTVAGGDRIAAAMADGLGAVLAGGLPADAEWQDGWRPVTGRVRVERAAPGLVVATGGHRVGLGLAPAAARRALALL